MPAAYIQLPPDSTGKKARTFERTVLGETVHEVYNQVAEGDAWVFTTPVITAAANRIYFAFMNTLAGQKLSLRGLWLIRDNATATGGLTSFDLKRISAVVGGTAVTPVIMDSTDTALSGYTAVHTATSATEGVILFPWYGSGEEAPATTTAGFAMTNVMYMSFTNMIPVVPAMKVPRFNQNEGFCVKMGATGTGTWIINCIISKEL